MRFVLCTRRVFPVIHSLALADACSGYRVYCIEDCCGDRTVEKHNFIVSSYGTYAFRRVLLNDFIAQLAN